MMMQWIAGALALAAASALPLPAAVAAPPERSGPATPSFDCARKRTTVERAICNDYDLADLDWEMTELYTKVIETTATPATVRARQRQFLELRGLDGHGEPAESIDHDTLAEIYRLRVYELRVELQRIDRAERLAVKPSELGRRCIHVGIENCRLQSSGVVAGVTEAHGPPLYYQIQLPEADGEFRRGVLILRKTDGVLRPVLWNYDVDYPEAPRVVQTPEGPLLFLPGREGGTASMNAEMILRPVAGGWRDIDIDAWRAAFEKRLPKGRAVNKGVRYDWTRLTAHTSLWKDTDANCCATGGVATAYLTIKDEMLVLKDLHLE